MARAPIALEALEFLQDLWALDHGMQSLSKRMLASRGVTGPQRLLVRAIGLRPGCTPGEAARMLHLHPATATRLASRLVRSGHVERRDDPADARRVRLALTAKGRRIDSSPRGTVEQAVREVLGSTTPARIQETRRVLSALTRRLVAMAAKGGRRAPAGRGGGTRPRRAR
ncbi:MAG: MarR family transcriptional regulator [Anaeromyxobacteraceae bacterium]|nr:MarR family transcriptional regulator [Anaeromyxobacteraceae bacterium]